MIRTVRKILMVLIPKYTVTDDLLHTILLEVEEMVNSRPLCLSLEPGSNVPLTPNHLLRIDPSIALPPIKTGPDDCYAHQRYRLVQLVADQVLDEMGARRLCCEKNGLSRNETFLKEM